MDSDRRRHTRVRLRTPVRGEVSHARVFLTDSSVSGVALAHQGTLPAPGEICRVELNSDWGPIRADCQVIRTEQRRMQAETAIFVSGLQIVVMDHKSSERLRTMIDVPIVAQDERLSSREAESLLARNEKDWRKRKPMLDATAAAVILQDYLDAEPRPAAGDFEGEEV